MIVCANSISLFSFSHSIRSTENVGEIEDDDDWEGGKRWTGNSLNINRLSLQLTWECTVHTERLAMLYNYFFSPPSPSSSSSPFCTQTLDAKVCNRGEAAVEEKLPKKSNIYVRMRHAAVRADAVSVPVRSKYTIILKYLCAKGKHRVRMGNTERQDHLFKKIKEKTGTFANCQE